MTVHRSSGIKPYLQSGAGTPGEIDGLGGDIYAGGDIEVDGIAYVQPDTLTSGGTDDFAFEITQTLNDSGAAGGSDIYNALKIDVATTDTTGWDDTNFIGLYSSGQETAGIGFSNNGGTMFILDAVGGSEWMLDGSGNVSLDADGAQTITIGGTNASNVTIGRSGQSITMGAAVTFQSGANVAEGMVIDTTAAEALLVRVNGDGGDVLTVNTDANNYSMELEGGTLGDDAAAASQVAFDVSATLNDTNASAGGEDYTGVNIAITDTDTSGWDSVTGLNVNFSSGQSGAEMNLLTMGTGGQDVFEFSTNGQFSQVEQYGEVQQGVTSETTADATPVAKIISNTDNDFSYLCDVRVTAINTDDGSEAAFYSIQAGYKNDGGVLTESFDNTTTLQEDDAAWNCTIAADGSAIKVTVTGAAGTNIAWCISYTVTSAGDGGA